MSNNGEAIRVRHVWVVKQGDSHYLADCADGLGLSEDYRLALRFDHRNMAKLFAQDLAVKWKRVRLVRIKVTTYRRVPVVPWDSWGGASP